LGATVLIYTFNFLGLLKRLLTAFFVFVILKPLYFILRWIFYKFIVRFYCYYLSILKKLGWSSRRSDIFSFIISQKLVHILVVLITILLIIINVTPRSLAGGFTDKAHQTILADLIRGEFGEFEDDEQLIIETFDKDASISATQQSYLDNLGAFRPQPRVNMNTGIEEELAESEELSTIQGGASLVKPDLATTKRSKKPRKEPIEYAVKPGDTVSTIAENYEISVSTILWENNLSSWSIIRPGNELTILPKSGITHKVVAGETIGSIAKKYKVEEEDIQTANKLSANDKLKIGDKFFIPGGKKYSLPAYTPKTYTGFSAIKDIVAPSAKPAAGNKMNWPTVGSRITQYYSWRHHGLDIANKIGTPIYAADSGTVEMVGWGQGYGNQIVINHGGGKKTRYAHLSKFYVKKGDQVSKGQSIAAMGSTGWSTGSHLHFEVIIGGRKYNPLNYIR